PGADERLEPLPLERLREGLVVRPARRARGGVLEPGRGRLEREAREAVRPPEREMERDPPTHRVADEVERTLLSARPRDPLERLVEDPRGSGRAPGVRVMARKVHAPDPPAAPSERAHELLAPRSGRAGEAGHEHDGVGSVDRGDR